ncbi:MAG: ABC transporter permease [Brevefilum sp.]
MKTLAIALKDLSRSFRSLFALAFMFGVPVLTTLLFAFLFGGVGTGEDAEFNLPKTDVILVNQDEGSPSTPTFDIGEESYQSLGAVLVNTLQDESFSDLMTVTTAESEAARQAVDAKQAGLAIIIPQNFTQAAIGFDEEGASLVFYQEPELGLGPQVIQSIVMSIVDDFLSTNLSLEAINKAFEHNDLTLEQQEQMVLLQDLVERSQTQRQSNGDLSLIPPVSDSEEPGGSLLQTILRSIMAGMMIFYAFFTGTSAAETILKEEEDGTIQRMLITPTATRTILNGKLLSGFLTVIIQVTVLLVFSDLVFGINWGSFFVLIPFTIGVVALSNAFGIFIMSLVKNTKQAGTIFGGVLTLTGMLGISSVFTVGTPAESAFKIIPLVVPQGWAMKSIEAAWTGNLMNSLLYAGGMLLWSLILYLIGNARFTRRLA